MPLFAKPQFNNVWANGGTKLSPDVSKISVGWVVEIPPYEFDNWIQNRQDALLAHINQVGVPMWDATVEYQAGKSYIQGTTSGVIYRAVTTNTNVNPELDIQGNWTVAFQASGQALLKSQNLADVPDKALARQNLGIATTEFYDGRYLTKANNLADVPNKASARTNLGLGNSSILDVGDSAGTVASGNDTRIVNAVQANRQVVAGNGLTGGGSLADDRTLTMGTPSTVTATSTNAVTSNTHYHALDVGSFLPTRWVNMTGSRVSDGTYWNTTGKLMFVAVTSNNTPHEGIVLAYVNDQMIMANTSDHDSGSGWQRTGMMFVVPNGASYRVHANSGIFLWSETQ